MYNDDNFTVLALMFIDPALYRERSILNANNYVKK